LTRYTYGDIIKLIRYLTILEGKMKNDVEIYRLLMRTARMARRIPCGREREEEAPRRWHGYSHVLDVLSQMKGMSQQEIADAVGIRAQSVSEAISAMEEQGLVRREQSGLDKRVMLVYLTERGEARREELASEREYKAKLLLCTLDDEEKDTLFGLLEKLYHTEEEHI